MALKPDRKFVDGTDISYFMTMTAQRGAAVVLGTTAGSGAAMDDPNAVVQLPTGASFGATFAGYGSGQQVMGVLLTDVVNVDLTKYHLNQHQDQVQIGGKVTLLRRGTCLTNMIVTGYNPTAGYQAIAMDNTGNMSGISYTGFGTMGNSWKSIGTWLSSKDADGYAKLEVNLV